MSDPFAHVTVARQSPEYKAQPVVVAEPYLQATIGTVTTPDAPEFTIDGDVRIQAKVTYVADGTGILQTIASNRVTGTPVGWHFRLVNGNLFLLYADAAGATVQSNTLGPLTALTPDPVDGNTVYVRADLVDVGAGQLRVTGYASYDGVTWVALANPRTDTARFPLYEGTDPLRIGRYGSANDGLYQGKILWAEMVALARSRLVFPGIQGNVLTIPDAPNLNPTGNIQVSCRVQRPSALSGATQRVVSKDTGNSAGNRGWCVHFGNTGQIGFALLPAGTVLSTAAVGFAIGAMGWIRLTRNNGTGAVTLEWAADSITEPTSWTALTASGSTTAGAIPVTTGTVRIGDRATNPQAPIEPFQGRIARVIIRDGSTKVLDVSEGDASTAGLTTGRRLMFAATPSLSVPDAANLRITGSIEIVARVSAYDWTPATLTTIGGRYLDAGNNRSYLFRLATSGALQFNYSTNGTDSPAAQSTATLPTLDGVMWWVKVTRNSTTGVVQFWYAPDQLAEPTAWTKLGADVATTAGNMNAGTAPMIIGAYSTNPWSGRIARYIVRNGIAGTTVLDINETNPTATGVASFVATTGQTVTCVQPTGWQIVAQSWREFTAATGQVVTIQDTQSTAAAANGAGGQLTTTDPGVLPNQMVLVWRERHGDAWSPALFPLPAQQADGSDPREYQVFRTPGNGRSYLSTTTDGVWNNRRSDFVTASPAPGVVDETVALAITFNTAGTNRTVATAYKRDDTTGVWTQTGTKDMGAGITPFDVTTALRVAAGYSVGSLIHFVECRTGLDPAAGTLLWRMDPKEYPGSGLSYVDPRGRTWTLSALTAIQQATAPVLQPQADATIWRFDAGDYRGASPFVDSRGRTWTLNNVGGLTRRSPEVYAAVLAATQPHQQYVATAVLRGGLAA